MDEPAVRHVIDLEARGAGSVEAAFANQVAYCHAAGAPITARICSALGELLRRGDRGEVLDRVRAWPGAPLADALPLRLAGGLHALHLTGAEPDLMRIYGGEPAVSAGDLDGVEIVGAALGRHSAQLLTWLDSPPQTNEAGRSAAFVAALLWLAGNGVASRFECLEIGSSAGINLMMARFRYELGGVVVGPPDAALRFAPQWSGAPPPEATLEMTVARGCDVAPIDLADPAQALRLKAFVWPDHPERFARIDAAAAEARLRPPDLVRSTAADFLEAELARPQQLGTTRVLMHSIVWQYLPAAEQARVATAMEQAGREASHERPLAWVELEANRTALLHELYVRWWPGGERTLLAHAHPHGASIDWKA